MLGLGIIFPIVCKAANENEAEDYQLLKQIIVTEFSDQVPHEWGGTVSGVVTHLKTDEKVLAIGLNVCGAKGDGQDEWIRFFDAEKIPVTLFVCGEWIDRNASMLKTLAANPLFEIANQGLKNKPCSVNGRTAGGKEGTRNIEEVFAEIEKGARKIESIAGVLPHFYRSGDGYYDEVAVRIVKALGYEAVGDTGGTVGASSDQKKVFRAFMNPVAGAIAIVQANSFSDTSAESITQAIRKLRIRGYKFAKLSDYPLE